MDKRNHRLFVRVNDDEMNRLIENANKTGLSKSGYVRFLVNGYIPRPLPPIEFHKFLNELRAIGRNINQIAYMANKIRYIDLEVFAKESAHLSEFILLAQTEILMPERIDTTALHKDVERKEPETG